MRLTHNYITINLNIMSRKSAMLNLTPVTEFGHQNGITIYKDSTGMSYYLDERKDSASKGYVFDRNPLKKGAKRLDVVFVLDRD